jgi:hypothetical protein
MKRCVDCTYFRYIPGRKKVTCVKGYLKKRKQQYFGLERVLKILNGKEDGIPAVLYQLAEKCKDYEGEILNGKKWVEVK